MSEVKKVTAMQEMIDIISENPNEFISKEDTLRLLMEVGKPKELEQIFKAYIDGGADYSSKCN